LVNDKQGEWVRYKKDLIIVIGPWLMVKKGPYKVDIQTR